MILNYNFPTINWIPPVLIFLIVSVTFAIYHVWGTILIKQAKYMGYMLIIIIGTTLIIWIMGQMMWDYGYQIVRGY